MPSELAPNRAPLRLVLEPKGSRCIEAMAELTDIFCRARPTANFLDDVATIVAHTLGPAHCEILECSPGSLDFTLSAYETSASGGAWPNVGAVESNPQASYVLSTRRPVITEDLRYEARFSSPERLLKTGMISSCAVPMLGREEPFGVLAVHSAASRLFTAEEIGLLQSAALGVRLTREKRLIEKESRINEQLFRSLLAHAPIGIALVAEDLRLVATNDALCEMLGYSQDELMGARIPIPALAACQEDLSRDQQDARKVFGGEVSTLRFERFYQTKHQGLLPANNIVIPIHDAEGKTVYAFVIVESLEQLRRINEELEQQASYLKALVENSPLAVVALDNQHRIKMCNTSFQRLFQYGQEELVGRPLDDLIAIPGRESDSVELTQRVLAGESTYAETRRRRRDGTFVDVEIYGVPLLVHGQQVGVYGLYHDISERKKAEKLLRELSGRLLRIQDAERRRIARELHDTTGQNLAALSMHLSITSKHAGMLDPRAQRALSESLSLAEQCGREIRTVSYLLHPPLIDDVGLIPALRWYASGFSERSGMQVNLSVKPADVRLPRDVEMTIFRIVQECLTNVHRHSGSHVAQIEILAEDTKVSFSVNDRGHGIPAPVLEKIRRRTARFGVGIAGMRERAEQLGGQLVVSSDYWGTTVHASLPIHRTDE